MLTKERSDMRFYHVCDSCTATWFCPYSAYICPRCGRRSESSDQREPPWLTYLPEEKEMLQVKLSDKGCLFCGKTTATVQAKSKEHDFQGVVCPEHMIAVLKKFEQADANGKPANATAATS